MCWRKLDVLEVIDVLDVLDWVECLEEEDVVDEVDEVEEGEGKYKIASRFCYWKIVASIREVPCSS